MCVQSLKDEGFDLTAFFFNPNIHPFSEYKKRMETLRAFCAAENIKLIAPLKDGLFGVLFSPQDQDEFLSGKTLNERRDSSYSPPDGNGVPDSLSQNKNVFLSGKTLNRFAAEGYGLYNFLSAAAGRPYPARCAVCYETRLDETARFAKENGYGGFSTTLFISPYQNHGLLKTTAETAAERYQTALLYRDFRALFREGQSRAKAAEMYMQKYCGCIFSEYENAKK
jgi:predicted adenine nucleotide alpha hydrolase (AANH) superfamily ATPase